MPQITHYDPTVRDMAEPKGIKVVPKKDLHV